MPRQIAQPIAVRKGVVVDVGDDLSVARRKTDIARSGEPFVQLVNQMNRVVPRNRRGLVRRAVVDDDHLIVRIIERVQGTQAFVQRSRTVVGADDHGNSRPVHGGPERGLVEGLAHRVHGGLGVALDVGDAKGPVVDLAAGAKPLVCPGKDDRACRPRLERRSDLPVERVGLRQLPIPPAVETQLGQQQRAVAGDVLQPRQIGLQLVPRFQVDVERDHV